MDPLHIIGELVLECLRKTDEPLILQYNEDLCRITFPARENWKGPRTFRGRGPLADAALAAWSDAAQALRSQPRSGEPRPRT